MSKSAGNFYRLADIVEKAEGLTEKQIYRAFRMMRLQNLYRDSFNFSFDKVQAAHNTLVNVDNTVKRLATSMTSTSDTVRKHIREELQSAMVDFVHYLEDDFDTVQALTVLFDIMSFANKQMDEGALSQAEVSSFHDFLESINQVLVVLDLCAFDASCEVPSEVQSLVDKRIVAKTEKRYEEADELREKIEAQGWKVVDDKEGSRVEKL